MQSRIVPPALALKAQLHNYSAQLGDSRYRQLVLRHSSDSAATQTYPDYADYLLYPRVNISNVPTNMVSMPSSSGSILLSINDLLVKNLPRFYAREFLHDDVEFYVVDPVFNNQGQVVGGIRCRLLDLLDGKMLSWRLVLRMEDDNEPIAAVDTYRLAPALTAQLNELNSLDASSQLWEVNV